MEEFSRTILVQKLKNLNLCRKKIRSICRWLLYHQDQYALVVSTWFEEMMQAEAHQQLLFIYLADDVIQHTKEEGIGYSYEFGKVLLATFKHMNNTGIDLKSMRALDIILNSWQKKGIYTTQKMQEFKRSINPTGMSIRPNKHNSASLESSPDYEQKPQLEKATEPKKPCSLLEAYCRWAESFPPSPKDKTFNTPSVNKYTGNTKDLPKATY